MTRGERCSRGLQPAAACPIALGQSLRLQATRPAALAHPLDPLRLQIRPEAKLLALDPAQLHANLGSLLEVLLRFLACQERLRGEGLFAVWTDENELRILGDGMISLLVAELLPVLLRALVVHLGRCSLLVLDLDQRGIVGQRGKLLAALALSRRGGRQSQAHDHTRTEHEQSHETPPDHVSDNKVPRKMIW